LPNYRIYMLDMNGRIVTGTNVVCADDPSAFGWAARSLGVDTGAEIWEAERCLGRLSDSAVPLDWIDRLSSAEM
jgi:hypothetical protein